MNNDATPTPAADLPANADAQDPAASSPQSQNAQTPAQKRLQAQTKKKYEFVNGLMNNLDALIYVELCILYYMDCSFFRLFIRAIAQMVFLTPKPNFVTPIPQRHPFIGIIFIPNALCVLLHLITARSEANESMRGYLHGGIIIDLIGQKGPTSKLHLVGLDLLVTALQCFMLAVHVERERLAASLAAFLSPSPPDSQPPAPTVSLQAHDTEEQSVRRDGVTGIGDIEMQQINNRNDSSSVRTNETDVEMNQEREHLLDQPPQRENQEEDDFPLDIFRSGTIIVAEFDVWQTLRTQWDLYRNSSSSAFQTVGLSAEFASVAANRRINAAGRRLQRGVESLAAN